MKLQLIVVVTTILFLTACNQESDGSISYDSNIDIQYGSWAPSGKCNSDSSLNGHWELLVPESADYSITLSSEDVNSTCLSIIDDNGNYIVSGDWFGFDGSLASGSYTLIAGTYFSFQTGDYKLEYSSDLTINQLFPSNLVESNSFNEYTGSESYTRRSSPRNIFYSFNLTESTEVEIFTKSASDTKVAVSILDEYSNLVEDSTSGYLFESLETGNYQVMLSTYYSGYSGDFEFNIWGVDNIEQIPTSTVTRVGTWNNSSNDKALADNQQKYDFTVGSDDAVVSFTLAARSEIDIRYYLVDEFNNNVSSGSSYSNSITKEIELQVGQYTLITLPRLDGTSGVYDLHFSFFDSDITLGF